MKRRTFLAWLTGTAAGVAAAATLDLDKLLWIPGEKTIFLPDPPPIASPKFVLMPLDYGLVHIGNEGNVWMHTPDGPEYQAAIRLASQNLAKRIDEQLWAEILASMSVAAADPVSVKAALEYEQSRQAVIGDTIRVKVPKRFEL